MSEVVPFFRFLGTPGLDQFALRALGYQFPGHQRPGAWDSNWLVTRGEVVREDQRWHFLDPCLTTDELSQLIAWLRRLPDSIGPIWFTEPLLHFEQIDEDSPWTLRLILKGEALPKEWNLSREERWDEGVSLTLHTTREQVRRMVEGLQEDMERFPPR